jgi:two-component system OmpR family response regulator
VGKVKIGHGLLDVGYWRRSSSGFAPPAQGVEVKMKKVLVVDDIKNIRNLLTTCLELEGYQVATAANGREALEMVQNNLYDLIFLDIKLPELSGTEILRRMRRLNILTPVIVMTAFGTVKNAVECTRLGAVAYLQKPFTADKVRVTLEEIGIFLENNMIKLRQLLDQAAALLEEAQPEEAYRLLKTALSIEPSCGETYALLAQVLVKLGKEKEAQRFRVIAEQFGN